MRVVICGGGVIGASLAYFLSLPRVEAVVVERTGVACAASGKSGGFLALDWCDGSPLAPLARRSFQLHAELAAEHGDRLGLSPARDAERRRQRQAQARRASGAAARAGSHPRPACTSASARPRPPRRCSPAAFTQGMMQAAHRPRRHAADRHRRPACARSADQRRVTGALVDGEVIEADAVVIAMGPWSVLAAGWLPLPTVYGLKGHSVVFRSGAADHAARAVRRMRGGGRRVDTPEVFPRPDGTTYVCGLSSEEPAAARPGRGPPDAGRHRAAQGDDAGPSRPRSPRPRSWPRQACYRPVARDGLPLIGGCRGCDGAYVATGHSVWGMLNAPATGEALAELIVEGASRTVDLAPFDPARLPPLG